MSLLSIVCDEMGLKLNKDASLQIPQKWSDFLSMKDDKLKLCKDNLLKELNLDSNTVERLWFNLHYLSLYQHFNIVRFILFIFHIESEQKYNVLPWIFNSFDRSHSIITN